MWDRLRAPVPSAAPPRGVPLSYLVWVCGRVDVRAPEYMPTSCVHVHFRAHGPVNILNIVHTNRRSPVLRYRDSPVLRYRDLIPELGGGGVLTLVP